MQSTVQNKVGLLTLKKGYICIYLLSILDMNHCLYPC